MPRRADAPALAILVCTALLLVLMPATAAGQETASAPDEESKTEATETTGDEAAETEETSYDLPEDVVTVKSAPELRLAPGETIDLSLRDADLVEVLRSFAVLGDFNLVVQPGVTGKVTVELHDVEWEKALAVILRVNGLSAEVDGNLWSVERRTKD